MISPPFRFPIGRVIIRNIIFINTIEHQRRQSSKNPCKSTIPTAIRIDLWKTLTRTKRGGHEEWDWGFYPVGSGGRRPERSCRRRRQPRTTSRRRTPRRRCLVPRSPTSTRSCPWLSAIDTREFASARSLNLSFLFSFLFLGFLFAWEPYKTLFKS